MREVELWEKMNAHLGDTYARFWAEQTVIDELGGRTVIQALRDGIPYKKIWRAVWAYLELPAKEK